MSPPNNPPKAQWVLKDIRIKTLGTAIAVLLGFVVLADTFVFWHSADGVRYIGATWRAFDNGAAAKGDLLSHLRGAIGYGGVIHEFKNFVLRRDRMGIVAVQRRLDDVAVTLTAYRVHPINVAEQVALGDLEDTLDQYAEAVATAERMASAGATPSEIDMVARIDDTPALAALGVLHDELRKARHESAQRVYGSVDLVQSFASAAALMTAVLSGMVILSLLWFTRARLIAPLMHLGRRMEALAEGDANSKIPALERRDEIGAMARTLQVFRDNLVERRRVQEELREAHDTLEQKVKERTAELEDAIARLTSENVRRMRVEEALQDSKARLSAILSIAPEAVIVANDAMRIQLFNKGAEAIFGYREDEMIGRSIEVLIPERLRAGHRKHVEAFGKSPLTVRGMSQRPEVYGLRKHGTEFPAQASVTRVTLGDEEIFTVILHDITERKQAEEALINSERALQDRVEELERTRSALEEQGDKLTRLAEDLAIARDEAESANRSKSAFLASMSHELRTPLNAVIGFSEIIKDERFGPTGSPQYQQYAQDIFEAGRHLLALINDILDLSKVESGKAELHEDFVDFPSLVQSAVMLVRARAEKHGVEIEEQIESGLPLLQADERKLKQVLANLLSNAAKFSNPGGKIVVKAWCRDESGFVFQVMDNGIGMAPEDIPTALSTFGQVDSRLSRESEGTGLGLPLSKSLIELHGGTLDLQSQVRAGTTVTVRLPAVRIVRLGPAASAPELGGQAAG